MPEGIPARILVVDDESLVRDLVRQMLEIEHYDCATASSGEEALVLLQNSRYDAMITDLMMPGMSGIDLVNVVKILYPDTAILIVTGLADPETNRFVAQLDVDGYLIKPFTGGALRQKLVAAISKRTAGEFAETTAPDGFAAAPEAERGFDSTEFVQCVKSGMTDAELMDKFRLTGGALRLFLEQMVSSGRLKRSDLNARASLSPGTVMLDVPPPPAKPRKKKPVIDARDAVACVRSGMDDVAIMKRYGISALGLRSLFLKLVDAGLLSVEEIYRYCAPKDMPSLQQTPRREADRYLAVAVPIYEKGYPDTEGSVLEFSQRHLGTAGIKAAPGQTKILVIPAQRIFQADEIRFEAVCTSSEKPRPGSEPLTYFRITKISKKSLDDLQELMKALALDG